ncbi:uncharacterized acetyltransferase At3g50280-like [Lotus japonicus]|uniref:uncharacterized acetyltransferase At3g50280-like n=1 Tax=Lotus japonicus TaxID=34305 RepID=UPI00258CE04A|nr:uncharacterized acetyltransferase At3g50280-like [Lotus japonicus]XP_057421015.1 uncharacterized acetyltransferase At3g50280-like [Lotus japonicus]
MADTRIISTTTVQATNHNSSTPIIHLTPWDLLLLNLESIQQGLLFHKPKTDHQIHHLKHTLSTILTFFPPFTGRLIITNHHDNNNNTTVTCHITCNNAGALFVHAAAEKTSIADIIRPGYVPSIVHSFFPLNGVKNYQGMSQPLLAVQVTELLDGVFIGFTMNHSVADGKAFWQFINSWGELSRGNSDKLMKTPPLERWFPNGIDPPIHFPSFTKEEEKKKQDNSDPVPQLPPLCIFHFSKEKLAELKAKANAEVDNGMHENRVISSLQALLTHIWRSVIRAQRVNPEKETDYMLIIDARQRMQPPLPENYLGNAGMAGIVKLKAGELLLEGKSAWEMNKMIALHTDEMMRSNYEGWLKTPVLITPAAKAAAGDTVSFITNSSPRFDFYGNDFGWGKPVAVRNGAANKYSGKITAFGGVEEGSIDLEVCLRFETLEAMKNDPVFMDAVSM